jgi:hypothetical protein
MAAFFSYFPTLLYANNAVTNIIAKVKFQDSVKKNLGVFYPYTVKEGERPDQIAEKYYEDSSYDWIVYMSNDIVDPYHQWPRTQLEMESYITKKYGSAAAAASQTAFYRVNYETDDRVITTAAYNALSAGTKQYWQPIVGYNDSILNYERKRQELIADTNCIQTLNGVFNEVPEIGSTIYAAGPAVIPKGTVAFANSTVITMKHVEGTWAQSLVFKYSPSGETVDGTITSVEDRVYAIPIDEVSYWSPVTWFDYEYELNETKRSIQLISATYVTKIERDMKELLQS